jgi:hypothetical protein
VQDGDGSVGGHADVELDHVRARTFCRGERRERVLARLGLVAAMSEGEHARRPHRGHDTVEHG